MRTTKTMTISLPPAIVKELDQYRGKYNFTRSELVRHALRELFYSQFPVEKPTKAELKAMGQGRRDIKNGNFISLEQLHAKLDAKNRQKSAKKVRPAAR
jgi:Arc/MetJ-type ribon-helix-helix transcriptional regulator